MARTIGAKNKKRINDEPKSVRLEVAESVSNLINHLTNLSPNDTRTGYLLSLIREDAKNKGLNPDSYGLTLDRVSR